MQANASTSRSVQADLKHHQPLQQKNPPKSRRSNPNTTHNPVTLTQLLFTASNNENSDMASNNEALSSPTINSNNITNEDLAEADQVCSSDAIISLPCDTASGISLKLIRNDQYRHQQQRQGHNAFSPAEHHVETDGNKNSDWVRKETSQSSLDGMKHEAESECFESFATFPQGNNSASIHSVDSEDITLGEVTSSNHSLTSAAAINTIDAEPIMNDAACAVIYHQTNSNVNTTIQESNNYPNVTTPATSASRANNNSAVNAVLPMSSSASNGDGAVADNKQKNGVP